MAINVSNLGTFMIGSLRSTDITLQGSSGNDLKISANPAATTSYQMVMPQTNGTLGDVLTIGGGSDLVWAPPTGITSVTATSTLGANKSGQMVVKDGNVDDRIIRLAGPRMVENGTGFDIANLNINGNVLKHFDGSGDVDIQLSPGHHTRILSPTSSPVVTIGEDGDVIAKSLQLGDSEPLGGASNPTSLQFVSGGINVLVDTTIDADLSLPDNHNLNLGNDDDLEDKSETSGGGGRKRKGGQDEEKREVRDKAKRKKEKTREKREVKDTERNMNKRRLDGWGVQN